MSKRHNRQTQSEQPQSALLLHLDSDFNDSSSACTPLRNDYTTTDLASGHFGNALQVSPSQARFLRYTMPTTINYQDFTIDFWAKCTSYTAASSFRWLFTFAGKNIFGTTGCFSYRVRNDGQLQFSAYNGSWYEPLYNIVMPLNTWVHLALCRKNGTLYQFVNGELKSTVAFNYDIVNTQKNILDIGACFTNNVGTNRQFNGLMDEFRVVVGTAVWTSDFTPPTTPYTK